MSHTLYFKTPNSNIPLWNRFALLYLNDCQFINNFNTDDENSALEERLLADTDLYHSIKFDGLNTNEIGEESIIFLEDIKSDPKRYMNVLHFSSDDKYYQNVNNKTFYLNEQCYCPHFINYCLENKFAKLYSGKVRGSMAVAMLYNKFFTHQLATINHNSILIDDPIFYNVINYIREINNSTADKNKIVKAVNSLVLPEHIERISLTKIIRFRNENRLLIKLFNEKLVQFYTTVKEGNRVGNLSSEYNDVYFELTNKILALGKGVHNVPHITYFELAQNLKDHEITSLTDEMGIFIVDQISSPRHPNNFSRRHLFNISASSKRRLF